MATETKTLIKPPRCTSTRHKYHPCGGMETNPGVWNIGGIDWRFDTVCVHCGVHREEYHTHDGHQWNERTVWVHG